MCFPICLDLNDANILHTYLILHQWTTWIESKYIYESLWECQRWNTPQWFDWVRGYKDNSPNKDDIPHNRVCRVNESNLKIEQQWKESTEHPAIKGAPMTQIVYSTVYLWRRSKKIFKLRVTGHMCGEFTGHRWIPAHKGPVTRKKASMWWRHNEKAARMSWSIMFGSWHHVRHIIQQKQNKQLNVNI